MVQHTLDSVVAYGVQSAFGTPATNMTYFEHRGFTPTLTKQTHETGIIEAQKTQQYYGQSYADIQLPLLAGYSNTLFEDCMEALFRSAFSSGTMTFGSTDKYLSFETNVSGHTKYTLMSDCGVSSLSLTIEPNSKPVEANFSIVSANVATGTSPQDASIAASTSYTAMYSSPSSTMSVGGDTTANVTSIDLTIANGLERVEYVGQSTELKRNQYQITGSLTTHFENNSMCNNFINNSDVVISVDLTDDAGNTYNLTMTKVRLIDTTETDTSNVGDNIIQTFNFEALYNATDGGLMLITKTDA